MASWDTTDHNLEDVALQDESSNKTYAVSTDYNLGSRDIPASPFRSWSQAQTKKKRRVRLCVIAMIVAIIVVLVVIVACAIAIPLALKNKKHSGSSNLQSLTDACNVTLYPSVCYDSLSNLTSGNLTNNPQQWVQLSLEAATDSVTQELTVAQALFVNRSREKGSPQLVDVLGDCVEFVQASLDSLGQTSDRLKSFNVDNLDDDLADLETWMSASLTTQVMCLDGIKELDPTLVNGSVADFVQQGEYNSMLLSNVLAFISTLQGVANDIPNIPGIPGHRRLLESNEATSTFLKRRLLTTPSPSTTTVVVAQDGSGNYRRIMDALKYAPQSTSGGTSEYLIHIKAGTYFEIVNVPKNAYNVVFLGDGIGKTIISGNLSVVGSKVTTSSTATLTVQGRNFIGRSFTVENTAGSVNKQAVALRVTGDYAAFESCEFLGYQDTLYTQTNRQFYLNCIIVGTVDFIFGNAAVVFQSSQIIATRGMLGQDNTYTASERTDPNQNTGITFQNCTFDGTASLKNTTAGTISTYLGRPWKDYARTVVMLSVESSVVNSAGWLTWNGAPPSSTIYYGEFQNTGPGYNPSGRVPWSEQINLSAAKKFTVDNFIQGKTWLPAANFTYMSSV